MSNFSFVDNIPFKIAAGDSLPIPAGSWEYLYMASLTGGDLLVEGAGFRVPLILGRQIRVKEKETGVILLTNNGSTEASGVLYAGAGDIEDRGIIGSVSVTNFPGSPKWSESGDSYMAFIYKGGVAAKYSHVQLLNPSGNDKNLIVNKMSAYHRAGARDTLVFLPYDTALTSVDASFGEANKLSSSSNISGAEFRIDELGSSLSSAGSLLHGYADDGETLGTDLDEPIILTPGNGIVIRTGSVNAAVGGKFQYHVEDV